MFFTKGEKRNLRRVNACITCVGNGTEGLPERQGAQARTQGESLLAMSSVGASLFQVLELGMDAGKSTSMVKVLVVCWNCVV